MPNKIQLTELNIFAVSPDGLKCHIKAIPLEGSNPVDGLAELSAYLTKHGFKPEPVRGFGGGGKPKEPIPETCPVCSAEFKHPIWANPQGVKLVGSVCAADETHYKRWKKSDG
jgi:hypothetical protein